MTTRPAHRWSMARTQVVVSSAVGAIAGVTAGIYGPVWLAPLVAWDIAALAYLAWTWRTIGRLDAGATADHATIDDPSRRASDVVVQIAAVVSLVAVGVVLVHASHAHGLAKALQSTVGISSVVVSWLVVHTTYTLRYAQLYHDGRPGGVDFNQDEAPRYGDFAYIAFTIGMTFQVSDTTLTSSTLRITALRHALLSYLFGTVIIATAINIAAGLAK
jgi:uncharacterized membrane protein